MLEMDNWKMVHMIVGKYSKVISFRTNEVYINICKTHICVDMNCNSFKILECALSLWCRYGFYCESNFTQLSSESLW